ncbi:hypothetical protein HUG20_06265 [Salicibibacter cibi]|uniref:Ribosomal protein L7/L12 C-terminal domain-containing protein n=1 Tax=Salicibibacter cibi TaxID=2743001 RepID=A0A7T6Z9Q8_9BACI|nr:hypothetical protein [Salicibibacter cibi]QQK79515.1 hypothetical protein HUG20_06265 [Salicibibacter cibi]
MEFNFIEILLLIIGLYLLFTVIKLDGRLKGLKYTLDQISEQVNIPENPINDELRKLIKDGEDVKAVKKVRETLGLSLVEGKQYVDALKFEDK